MDSNEIAYIIDALDEIISKTFGQNKAAELIQVHELDMEDYRPSVEAPPISSDPREQDYLGPTKEVKE